MSDVTDPHDPTDNDVSRWWETAIIDMEPGRIEIRGRPIQDLIGNVSFAQMIWLMLRGELPDEGRARLLETALVAAVDHGPQAPSIATARMAVTCGLPLNAALASAVNMLGDVHGGAGEQTVELMQSIRTRIEAGVPLADATREGLAAWRAAHGKYIPGFGHRFHKPVDPRAPRLMALVSEARDAGTIDGRYQRIGLEIERQLAAGRTTPVPMNIDGATAVIYAELGFEPALARGLFCLSRSVGILAHAWEQQQQGGRNKGPTPPGYRWRYSGQTPDT